MFKLVCLPRFYREAMEPLRKHFEWGHFLSFSWLLLIIMLHQGSGNLAQISAYMPLSYQLLTRFVSSSYWNTSNLWEHMLLLVLDKIPGSKDGICYVIADATDAPKRSKCNPYAKKGKKNKNSPWLFGLHILVISFHWSHWRIPVAFKLVKAKNSNGYINENELLRTLLPKVKMLLPAWVKQVIFLADSAYASKSNFRCLEKLKWFYVIACAKTWNLADGTPLKDKLTKLQKNQFKGTWIPSDNGKQRRWFHVRKEYLNLNELGYVTVVFSKTRRNNSSASAKVLLTNLPNLTSRDILIIYQKRWHTEVMFKELKSGLGLGQMQVTKDPDRVERSIVLGLMAYICLLRLSIKANPKMDSWSIFQAKWNLLAMIFQEKHFIKKGGSNQDYDLEAA